MSDEAAVVRVAPAHPLTVGVRVRRAVRTPHAWLQLLRFALVGASGYLVNLVVFAAAVHGAGFGYKLSATLAFLVAVSNNFLWNRHWTFRAGNGRAHAPGGALPARQHGRVPRQPGHPHAADRGLGRP